jgi:hypothetical protein
MEASRRDSIISTLLRWADAEGGASFRGCDACSIAAPRGGGRGGASAASLASRRAALGQQIDAAERAGRTRTADALRAERMMLR